MTTTETGKLRKKRIGLLLQLARTWNEADRVKIQEKIEAIDSQLKNAPRHEKREVVAVTEDNWLSRWFKR